MLCFKEKSECRQRNGIKTVGNFLCKNLKKKNRENYCLNLVEVFSVCVHSIRCSSFDSCKLFYSEAQYK